MQHIGYDGGFSGVGWREAISAIVADALWLGPFPYQGGLNWSCRLVAERTSPLTQQHKHPMIDDSLILDMDADEERNNPMAKITNMSFDLSEEELPAFRRATGLDPSGKARWDAEDFDRASAWLSKHASETSTEGNRPEPETRQKAADMISNTVLSHDHER
jgi:hypothetical protein